MKKRNSSLLFTFHFSFFTFIFSLLSFHSSAQTKVIDSLKTVLSSQKADTVHVNTLNYTGIELFKAGKFNDAIATCKEAETLAEKLNYKKGVRKAVGALASVCERQGNYTEGLAYCNKALELSKAYNAKDDMAESLSNIGNLYDDQGDYQIALDYYRQALVIDSAIGDIYGMSSTLGDMGNVYDETGNYPKALEFDLRALKYGEQQGNKHTIIVNQGNIANIYFTQGNYNKALENYKKVLDMAQQLGDQADVAVNLGNIGLAYFSMGNYTQAIEVDTKALKLDSVIGSKQGIAYNLGNLGDVYQKLLNFPKAIECDSKAMVIARQMNDKYAIGQYFYELGSIYTKQKNFWMAKICLDSALIISKKIGAKENVKYTYSGRIAYDSAIGDFKSALTDYKGYVAYRDSLVNEENTKKTVQAEMNYAFDKKQALAKLEQDKKDAEQHAEQSKQQAKLYVMSGVLGLVLLFTIFILLSLRANRKKTIIISKQKEEVEKQKTVVEEQNVFIEHQKAIVEEKNKDITDSIKYASRIQRALLTSNEYISQHLPEYFILFKPRDIVSGDFYWAFNGYGVFYIACCDCTGHGVPGAFMSLLNISMLNEAVIERKISRPDRILNDVRDNIIKALNPEKSDTESKDGMDCTICAIDMKNLTMQSACANNTIWVVASPTPPKEGLMKENGLSNLSKGEAKNEVYETADPMLYGKLRDFVKEHRSKPTDAEVAFWEIVRGRRLNGFKFRRQHIISQYIADFVCLPYKLVIEIDGLIHQLPENIESDRIRTEVLAKLGFKVLRLKNEEVINDPDGACTKVLSFLNMYKGNVVPDNLPNEGEAWPTPTEAPPSEGLGKAQTFIELPVDKMPVGIQHGEQKPFTLQNTKLTKGDTIYMFTDGYADQFGGPKGKKFKYKALQEKLIAISHQPLAEQKQILDKTIEDWRGNLEQVDDILIIGIRV